MFIRANKTTNEIDDSLIVSDLQYHTDIILEEGWEWIDTADSWYKSYEETQLQLEKELADLEFELKAETLELNEKELIAYLLKQKQKQDELIDFLLIEVLNA